MNQTYVLLKPYRSYFFLSFFFNEKKEDLMLTGYFCFSVKKSLADIFFQTLMSVLYLRVAAVTNV